MTLTIKSVVIHEPHGVAGRGALEIETSGGAIDSIMLQPGMPAQQVGHLLVQLGHRLLKRHFDSIANEGMDEILARLRERGLLKTEGNAPIKVSRFHMGDLEAAALNCGNERIRENFERMKKDPGFEIIDDPKPGEFVHDLSIMFMYPNEILPIDINKK